MKILSTLLAGIAAIALVVPAYAADTTPVTTNEYNAKANGGYDAKTSSKIVTNAGTEKSTEKTTDVDVDADGSTTKTIKSKSVTDPEGLMNKKKAVVESKIKKTADGIEVKKTDEKTDMNGTDVSTESKTKVEVDADGNVKTTTETEKSVDPKGLFNSEDTTTTTKTINGKVVK